jgi:arylformamidase
MGVMFDGAFSDELDWRSLSTEDREREYSPSSCVGGDIQPFLTEYADGSDSARSWCRERGLELQTLSYGSLASQTIDIVVPATEPAPLVVFIHGGYWQELSKRESFSPAPGFLSHGMAFAAVDYTLAPFATVEEIVTECRQAIATIRSQADGLGINANRIVVAGSSAGGHLTAMISLDPDTSWRPAAMVLLSGIFELEPLIGTNINDALDLDVPAAHRCSPAQFALTSPPPAVVAWGEHETSQFKRQSHLFAQLLRAADGDTTELEVAGRNHFDILTDLGDGSSQLGAAVIRLIEST